MAADCSRREASEVLDRVAGLAADLRLGNLAPLLAACRRHCNGSRSIDVAVLGQFKAGKSSLINSLVRRAVVPVGVVPLTAVITRVRGGPIERAEVRFLDGRAEGVTVDDIGLYVGEQDNPGNAKRVGSVEVELPGLERLGALELVDTPGLGSVLAHNSEVALAWLPNVGAALVAVSCDAPLSERDLALLEELRRHTPRIVLVLTKADLLDSAGRAEVLGYVRRQVNGRFGPQVPVFLYSVREVELRNELESRVLAPLIRERVEAKAEIARHKLGSLVAQTLGYVRVALAAATENERARQTLRERLAQERRELGLLCSELRLLAQEWSGRALEFYLERLQSTEAVLKERATGGFEEEFGRWPGWVSPLMSAWRGWLAGFLRRELAGVSQAEAALFAEPQRRAGEHLARMVRAFHARLGEHVRAALGISLSPAELSALEGMAAQSASGASQLRGAVAELEGFVQRVNP